MNLILNGIVFTDKDKCEACSACLRVCQTKSIRIVDGKAEVIEESCLNCGLCVNVCSKSAKKYKDSIESVEAILQNRQKTAIVLAPSYVIIAVKKYHCTPGQFCNALRKAGFSLVYESSFGADIVTKVYMDYINDLIQKNGKENTHVIASPCPSLMNFVEKHTPVLIDEFAPVVSPMVAQAILVKYWNDDSIAIVGANPCVAKKSELLDKDLCLYDEDLTFAELITLIDNKGILPTTLEEAEFDGIQAFYGSGFPISGGLTKTLELFSDKTEINPIGNDILILEGEERSTEFLRRMAKKKLSDGVLTGYPLLMDILYCEGCIMGKASGVESDFLENKRIISEYTQKRFSKIKQPEMVKNYKGYTILVKNTAQAPEYEKWLDIVEKLIQENKFTREWHDEHYDRKIPSEEELKAIKEADGKFSLIDELNCGACGYLTCNDRATAVHNGENELGGCIIHQKHVIKTSLEENKRLHELDDIKSEFISTVSHELRTPLTSVLGFAKIIRKRLVEVVFPQVIVEDKKVKKAVRQVNENLDIIIAEGERLTSLINDVLDIAKMEAGEIEWSKDVISIEELIERATAATSSLFEQKSIQLIKEIEEGLPQITGDRDRLIQTMINLISNALKFTVEGSVTCKAVLQADEIIISITDTGIGIAEENLGKVFERFKQIGDTLTDKPKGTGLGLPICKQIIEHHGGRLWLESELGKGSKFSFSVPCDNEAEASIKMFDMNNLVKQLGEHAVSSRPVTNHKKKILVVDDEANIRRLLRQELTAVGYSVREAGDGLEAIKQAKKEMPDLIILDIMMPKMNGFDVAAVLKNDPVTKNIPVVILSIVEDRERGYHIGVDRYFTKPVNTEELLKEIGVLVTNGGTKKKVLVFDEDESTARILSTVLMGKGYAVVDACADAHCLKKALEERPDMVIVSKLFAEQPEIIRSLRFEKGMENVLFLMLGDSGDLSAN